MQAHISACQPQADEGLPALMRRAQPFPVLPTGTHEQPLGPLCLRTYLKLLDLFAQEGVLALTLWTF